MILKTLYAVEIALLVLSIVVQYNDPDPVIWMILYAVPLALVVAAAFGRPSFLCVIGVVTYTGMGLYCMPWERFAEAAGIKPQWAMMSPENEAFREGFGLILAAVFLILPAWQFLRENGWPDFTDDGGGGGIGGWFGDWGGDGGGDGGD